MRAKEFILENDSGGPGISNLLTVLDNIRNRFDDVREPPQIRVDSLVSMMKKIPGSEMFNVDSLMSAYEKNSSVKNVIKDVKDGPNGVKYIYLKPALGSDVDDINIEPDDQEPIEVPSPEKTVDQMSKRALKRRS